MNLDLEPRHHSSNYELKPMSRWWFVLAIAITAAMSWASGFFEAATWAMFISGAIVAAFALLCFPRVFLTKDR